VAVRDAAQQAWPPFVLVGGLLLIGLVAHAEGLFARAGSLLERVPGPPVALLAASIGVVAVVTAILNLDTAVVFLTPILVLAARARGLDEAPFLYASVYLANASSLYLPGSNLTNLLVLARDPQPGGTFAARLVGPAVAATVATAIGVWFLFRRELRARPDRPAGAKPGRVGWLAPVATGAAAAIGAVGAIGLNNLPATVLLSAQPLPHPRALLIGVNLGPNLAVTGSLAAYLWFRAAGQVGARPSVVAFTRRGLLLAPLAIAAALASL
jgi:arsenical pump membrane protein